LIIFVSNIPLRGLWSFLIILFILLMVVIFALWGVWEDIIAKLSLIDIRINAGGYFFISFLLFVIWAVTMFIFDHRTYVAITPGQVRMCLAVGAGETVYDTTGMTFQKKQDDLFRHWIIGLGSGDLIMHRSGTREEIDMPNVLFIGAKIKEIEQLIKEKEVV
jgi:FlaA1/EpsC-like NDP-sugar epimerase